MESQSCVLALDERDRVLVVRAIKGHNRAFDEIDRAYRHRLENFCLRFLPNETDAKDAAQHTLVEAHLHLPSFQGNSAFSTWLFKIAKYYCLNCLRGRKQESMPFEIISDEMPDTSVTASLARAVEQKVLLKQLVEAVKTKARTRKPAWQAGDYLIFETYYLSEARSVRETARILDKNYETVKGRFYTHIYPIIEELKQEYGED